jgi:hypothetical protein
LPLVQGEFQAKEETESSDAISFQSRSIIPTSYRIARMRCGRFITSGASLARVLVTSDSKCVQCDGHKNLFRPHSILPQF